jgi:hypothetical protein
MKGGDIVGFRNKQSFSLSSELSSGPGRQIPQKGVG